MSSYAQTATLQPGEKGFFAIVGLNQFNLKRLEVYAATPDHPIRITADVRPD